MDRAGEARGEQYFRKDKEKSKKRHDHEEGAGHSEAGE